MVSFLTLASLGYPTKHLDLVGLGLLIVFLSSMGLAVIATFSLRKYRITGEQWILLKGWEALSQIRNAKATQDPDSVEKAKDSIRKLGRALPSSWSLNPWFFHGRVNACVDALGRILLEQSNSLDKGVDFGKAEHLLTQILRNMTEDDPRKVVSFLLNKTAGMLVPKKTAWQHFLAFLNAAKTHRSVTLVCLAALTVISFGGLTWLLFGTTILIGQFLLLLAGLFFSPIMGWNIILPKSERTG